MLEIVIVNYHTDNDLLECCDSLVAFAPTVEHRVLIVNCDGRPEDNRVAEMWCERRPNWAWVDIPNMGYAGACNLAGATSVADVIAFFNADVKFRYGVLDACYTALATNDRWGILGPRQVDDDGKITHAGIFGTHEKPELRGWHRRTDEYQEVRDDAISVSGSAYFVKMECWNELTRCRRFQSVAPFASGAFLPTRHYYEETWCSYHAFAHNWKVVYWGLHTMVHKWHRASPVGGAADRLMPESRALFRTACDEHGIPHD